MIYCGDEHTDMYGTFIDIFLDLACIIRDVKRTFQEDFDEETVDKIITLAGKAAYVDEDGKDGEKQMRELAKELETLIVSADERKRNKE